MLYKQYGKTGKKVSALGFGGMRFDKPSEIERNAEIVLYAHNKGINYFDTAPGYCEDKSEDIMGAALSQLKRDSFLVSTKCGDPSGDGMRKSLESSLKRIKVDYLDFFHVWCVTSLEDYRRRVAGGAVAAAVKAREEGLVRHVVISIHMLSDDFKQVLADNVFEGVTLGYCAINFPFRQAAVDAAGAGGLGVVTMNPLGGGLIPQQAKRLDFIRSPKDRSVVEAAIRFNVSQDAITTALVGFTTNAHIDEACAAVENFRPYGPEHIEAMRTKLRESFNGLCTGCGYCLPCPHDIDIPKIMDTYNMKVLATEKQDPIREMQDRLKWHWWMKTAHARQCAECGQCEDRCTQHLPIMERMKEVGQLKDLE